MKLKKVHSLIDKFIYILIFLNVGAMIFESHKSIRLSYETYFHVFEIISIVIFSAEYIYRITHAGYNKGVKGAFSYVLSFYGLVDLISILPFYLNQIVKIDGRFFRILRLFRLTRIFKVGRKSKSLKVFTRALKSVKSELSFTLFLSIITILFSASAIYYLETKPSQKNFQVSLNRSGGPQSLLQQWAMGMSIPSR